MTDLALPPDRTFTPGTRTDISHEDYLAIDAFSASGSKRILQSPMHYAYDRSHPSDPTASQAMGTALHMAILEPMRFASDVIVKPEDAPKRPTATQINAKKPSDAAISAIDFWADFDRRAEGKLLLSGDQAEAVAGMVESVRQHPIHDAMFCDGRAELTMQWVDAKLGIPCKARFDYLRDDGIALDLKSCTNASAEEFVRSVARFKYHYQEAHYRNGYEHLCGESLRAFLFVAVENTPPHACAVYVIESNAVRFAIDRVDEAMQLYAEARRTGEWRGYPQEVTPLTLPRWAISIPSPY